MRELAGALGDYGTFLPFAVGYITVCGLDPTGFLLVMGLANILTGLCFRLPLPIEPQKVLSTVANAQHGSPSLVYAAGFGSGLVWLLLGLTGWIRHVAERTPRSVVQGIQLTLGVLLAVEGLRLMATQWLLGLLAVGIILGFRQHRFAPATLILTVLGLVLVGVAGRLPAFSLHLRLPSLTAFTLAEIYEGLIRGGLAQIPLTATNAILATAALLKAYWPERPKEEGVTVFLTTHYLEEAERLCDRIALIVGGRIIILDTLHGLKAAAQDTTIVEVTLSDETGHIETNGNGPLMPSHQYSPALAADRPQPRLGWSR
jgi:hypothetical protein